MGPNEIIYQQGSESMKIYFIQHGRVKLFIDVNNHVYQSNHLEIILKQHTLLERQLAEKGESMQMVDRPNFLPIIQYSEGSHIGDTDVIRSIKGLGSISRDMYAFTGNTECILF